MTIVIGNNPENEPGINKYLSITWHEGLRGKIIGINKKSTEAVVICVTSSLDGDCEWGKLYLIEEINP